jgi:hypothetical protein
MLYETVWLFFALGVGVFITARCLMVIPPRVEFSRDFEL